MRPAAFFAGAALALAAMRGPAAAQAYATIAGQPDARDFVGRSETHLTLLGNPLRFMGFDIGWLGFHADGSPPAKPLTVFEIRDALATVQALGGTVVRTRPILAAPCAACGKDAAVAADPAALLALDLVLKTARDMGLKVIVPLVQVDRGDCGAAPAGGSCAYVRARGLSDSQAFFTDAGVRTAFAAALSTLPDRVNALTNTSYRDDPTILAWENCLACGASGGLDEGAEVSAWSEQVGEAVKAADHRHLYENGAFAGRIAVAGGAIPAKLYATPSVDIVGDAFAPGSDLGAIRDRLQVPVSEVVGSGRAYVMDNISWTPAVWKTDDSLQAWLTALARQRDLSGGLVGMLEGHAEAGGFLPSPPGRPDAGVAGLYFPGIATRDMDARVMQARNRALHRFAYAMQDVDALPAYLLPPEPEITSVSKGHVVWRGSAGAADYSIERSPDPGMPWTWVQLCDRCVTDVSGGWQDPSPPKAPAWYRLFPFNINGHKSVPSKPVQSD